MSYHVIIRGENARLHIGAGVSRYTYQGGHYFLFVQDPDDSSKWQVRWQDDRRPRAVSPMFTVGASATSFQEAINRSALPPIHPWDGLCPRGLHGLDYRAQPCDLCPKQEGT